MRRIRFVVLPACLTVLMLDGFARAEAATGSPSELVYGWASATPIITALIGAISGIIVAWITYSPLRERLKSQVERFESTLLKDEIDLRKVIADEAALRKSTKDETALVKKLESQVRQQQAALRELKDIVARNATDLRKLIDEEAGLPRLIENEATHIGELESQMQRQQGVLEVLKAVLAKGKSGPWKRQSRKERSGTPPTRFKASGRQRRDGDGNAKRAART